MTEAPSSSRILAKVLIDIVAVILWLVLRLRVVYQRAIKG